MRRPFFRIICCILAAIIVMSNCNMVPVYADNPAKNAMKSVVKIVVGVSYDGDFIYSSSGTGVCVGVEPFEYVITNKHVVEADMVSIAEVKYAQLTEQEQMEVSELAYYLQLDSGKVNTEIYVVADGVAYELSSRRGVVLSNADLALLHLNTTIRSRQAIAFGSTEKLEVMDKVYALGYPAIAEKYDDKVATDGFLSELADLTATDGIVSRKNAIMDGVTYIQHTADINHGNSGGPLVNENGLLIGINTLGWGDSASSVYFSIDVEEVIRFLKQNNVSWIEAKSGSSGSSSTSGPNKNDMKGCDNRVTTPDADSWLPDYVTQTIKSKLGNGVILRYMPIQDFDYNGYNNLGLVKDGTTVTELARQNGFSLVKTSAGQVGWVPSHLFA